ncbi:MAG: hypothetical protein WCH34_08070 [Bacteroidota bacterium]
MKLKIYRIILPVFFLCFFFTAPAQTIKKFSKNNFIEELNTFFQEVNNKDDKKAGEALMKDFGLLWNSMSLTDSMKAQFYNNCNLMLKRKLKPFPHFKSYISTFTEFINSTVGNKSLASWQNSLKSLIEKSSSAQFIVYLEQTQRLVTDNVIYASNATQWKSSSTDFQFEYDTTVRITFPKLDLICNANKDSSVIYETQGTYYPLQNLWKGKGGKVDWKRAGYDEGDVYAELGKYEIPMKYSKYSADTVKFYHSKFFNYPLIGGLQEKIMADITDDKATYPRFTSYDNNIEIKDIFKDIDYEGGFSMWGAKFMGSGNSEKDASLIFKYDGKPLIKTTSSSFSIRKDRISSASGSATIYWEQDSIYHPGIEVKYLNEKKELSLLRMADGLGRSPYFDTWHKIDMYFEAIYWKVGDPKMELRMIKSASNSGEAVFESFNFYAESRYDMIQGLEQINPLYVLRDYYVKTKNKTFSLEEMVKEFRRPADQVQVLLMNLANMGFIIYDYNHNTITLKNRLFDYLNSKNKKTDYDVLRFVSTITALSNATLNLLNFDLKLRGVPMILLSDSQNVFLYPTEQEINLKKNRDFTFSGRVHAGLFDFYTKESSFDYNNFKINLPIVDSVTFYVQDKTKEKDIYGRYPIVKVRTAIEDVSGDLLIDQNNNKSGIRDYPDYPIFNSKNVSYIYYNKSFIERGAYVKDRFFFHVDPFTIKNLDKFATEDMKFAGTLNSGGIFPDIVYPLTVQPDFSLGFVYNLPEAGLPAYKGKGTYFNTLDLSYRGFRGRGKLNYLTSTMNSEDIIFYLDSMNAYAHDYVVKEVASGTEYPPIKGTDVMVHWMPYEDEMTVAKKATPLNIFANNEVNLHGKIILSPTGTRGSGIAELKDAEIAALNYTFKHHEIFSDSADFKFKNQENMEISMQTNNYKTHIDFSKRKGDFVSNGGLSRIDFPQNMYMCYGQAFDWYMDKSQIAINYVGNKTETPMDTNNLRAMLDVEPVGNEIISTHPAQDSLRFRSTKAIYNLKDYIIDAQGVSVIRVADAAIFPENKEVTILRKAEMKQLQNAKIIANTDTKYHQFNNAVVNINSRKNYNAIGNYEYVDENDKKFNIYFDRIWLDSANHTTALGTVPEKDDFALSPYFDYTGKVKLTADKEFLTFTGGTKIVNPCDTADMFWLKFESEINPKSIYIPIPDTKLKDINNANLYSALFFSKSSQVYASFISNRGKLTDAMLLGARGFLSYNNESKEYRIASREKLNDKTLPGNYLSFNTEKCSYYGEGKLGLGFNFGRMEMNAYGKIDYQPLTQSSTLDIVMNLDFFFNEDALKFMADDIEKDQGSNDPLDLNNTDKYIKALSEIFDTTAVEKIKGDLLLQGGIYKKLPQQLTKTIFIGDVKLNWDSITKSYHSTSKIGLASIGKIQINKFVGGHIEIEKKRSGDVITLYLEMDQSKWYYFSYSNNIMQVISSEPEFNKFITEMKPEKRRLDPDDGKPGFTYTISTERRKKEFLKKFTETEVKND